jgi:hypothetical protein
MIVNIFEIILYSINLIYFLALFNGALIYIYLLNPKVINYGLRGSSEIYGLHKLHFKYSFISYLFALVDIMDGIKLNLKQIKY